MSTDIAMLAEIPMFELMDAQEQQTLSELLDSCSFSKGETIFSQDDAGDSLFLVRNGRVQAVVTGDDGKDIIVSENERGDVFGEISLLDGGPRTASAIAVEDTECLSLDREGLLALVEKHPHVAIDLLTVMGRRLRSTDELLRTGVSKNVNEEMEDRRSQIEKAADWIAEFSGSISFLVIHMVLFFVWIVLNIKLVEKIPGTSSISMFDPFPFGLLTMAVSLEAIFLSVFVLLSQNRQAAKDHIRSDIEYEVNLKAELEVAQLHRKVDKLHEELQGRLARIEKHGESRPVGN